MLRNAELFVASQTAAWCWVWFTQCFSKLKQWGRLPLTLGLSHEIRREVDWGHYIWSWRRSTNSPVHGKWLLRPSRSNVKYLVFCQRLCGYKDEKTQNSCLQGPCWELAGNRETNNDDAILVTVIFSLNKTALCTQRKWEFFPGEVAFELKLEGRVDIC
jgi:hypothetical protein